MIWLMHRVWWIAIAFFFWHTWPTPLPGQTVTAGKQDSVRADSLNAIRQRLNRSNTGRDRNKIDSIATALRVPHGVTPPQPENKAPIAGFNLTLNDSTGLAKATSTSTDDGGVANLSFFWSWGDGATSTARNSAQHTYSKAGAYTVGLTVTDTGSKASTATKSISYAPPVPPTPTPPAPVATFTVACDPAGSLKCHFDGSASTGTRLTYAWDCGPGTSCSTITANVFDYTYPSAGDRTTSLLVTDSLLRTSSASKLISVNGPPQPSPGTDDSLPALPLKTADFQPKPCTRSVDVLAGANLQTALNGAQSGDCLELQPGARWQGNFTLPAHSCASSTEWITVRTKGVLDVPGTRMDTLQALGFAQVVQANNQYAFATAPGADCWQVMHLNIARDTAKATTLVYHLLLIGASASDGNTSPATAPSKIIFRRNWVHGTVDGELIRCFAINGSEIAVVDNWIDDCHASGFDSQAIESWNGPGPYHIENNFAAGAGENIMFGGAGPANSEMRPSDITIRRNHIYKRPEWKGRWSIKNIFELKNAQRLLIDANVFENSWASSQIGFAVVFKSSTGGTSDTVRQGSTDITFTNNRVNNSNLGLNIQARDCTAQACILYPVSRVLAYNNLFTNVGTSNGITGSGWLNPTYSGPTHTRIRNNTFVSNTPGRGFSFYLSGGAQTDWGDNNWNKNIFAGNTDYTMAADCAQPTHMAALDCIIGPGKWTYSGNVVSGVLATYQPKNPPGNTYKLTQAEIGLQPDYSAPSFPGVGADIPTLTQKLAGVAAVIPAPVAGARRPAAARRPPFRATRADSVFCARNACLQEPKHTKPPKTPTR